MSRSLPYVALSALALLQGVAAQANHVANKNTLFSGLNFDEPALLAALPAQTPVSLTQWAYGTVPQGCASYAGNHCSVYDLEVYDVTYSDCAGNPWTLCRCKNATWTVSDMTEMLGRMPVKARQYTRTYMAVQTLPGEGGNAFTSGPDTVFQDTVNKDVKSPTVCIHEMAHTIDFNWMYIHGGSGLVSETTGFVNAINQDTCVPDPYSRSNDVEDFAQVTVLGSYDKNAGGIGHYASPACLQNQLSDVENTIGVTLTRGGTCDFTWARDTVICMGPNAPCNLSKRESETAERRASSVPVKKVPAGQTGYSLDHANKMFPGKFPRSAAAKKAAAI